MEPIYQQEFLINDSAVDRYGRLKPSMLLFYVQEVAGQHVNALSLDHESLARRGMFWAIIRQRVMVSRMPRRGETIRVETWPMPTTRSAYPRSVVAYDQSGGELFRSISVWVLMDVNTRRMILPTKSGISVPGTLRGSELAFPSALPAQRLRNRSARRVCFTDLDCNGHMNNARYLDWIDDLLPSDFHKSNTLRELVVCYLSEAREGQELTLQWEPTGEDRIQVDAVRAQEDQESRIFSAQLLF